MVRKACISLDTNERSAMNHTSPSRRTGVRAALLASGLLAAAAAQALAQADLILTNGKIATMVREGEFVQAVAVKS